MLQKFISEIDEETFLSLEFFISQTMCSVNKTSQVKNKPDQF